MWLRLIFAVSVLSPAAAKNPPARLLTGTFSNEEQVYFDTEANRLAPEKRLLRVVSNGDTLTIERVDEFGAALSKPQSATIRHEDGLLILDYGKCQQMYRSEAEGLIANGKRGTCDALESIIKVSGSAITLDIAGQNQTELRRSRPISCWVAILKDAPKADGSEDWFFTRDVRLHDQGGRARAGGNNTGAPELVLRVRNVTWGKGSANKPAITLYVHKPTKPDRAEAYSWAAPDSSRVGINLRWMQSGCTVEQ
ncbi:hypothetical protein [Sphingorhabdus sp.]|jgi:hypothetical protein|uniref:hypothetical protein n=1 Tax=Sphingorhabdus sp. TaxID=1902408 RepID=UPI0037C5A410